MLLDCCFPLHRKEHKRRLLRVETRLLMICTMLMLLGEVYWEIILSLMSTSLLNISFLLRFCLSSSIYDEWNSPFRVITIIIAHFYCYSIVSFKVSTEIAGLKQQSWVDDDEISDSQVTGCRSFVWASVYVFSFHIIFENVWKPE